MVERHHGLIRQLRHNIEGQSTSEGLPVTDEDIVFEACYAKNNMLEICGQHPITEVFGVHPSVLPDFAPSSLAITDEQLSPDHAANRDSVRLGEIAVKCMVEATTQSRLIIADKTQARGDGRELEFTTGDLVDYDRKPEGLHAKDTSGWRVPATICDLTRRPEGSI